MPFIIPLVIFAFAVGFAAGAVGIFLLMAKPDDD